MNPIDLKQLKRPLAVPLKNGRIKVMFVPLKMGEQTSWVDLQMTPLTVQEYKNVKAYLHALLSPMSRQIRASAPQWADLVHPDAKDDAVTIERVYDAMAPRIVNWSLSVTHALDAPATSSKRYAVMAALDSGTMLHIGLILLRKSEVGGLPPTGEEVA